MDKSLVEKTICDKENSCPAWKFIQTWYIFWRAVGHCPYYKCGFGGCIMSEEEIETATQNLKLIEQMQHKATVLARTIIKGIWFLWAWFKFLKDDHPYGEFQCFLAQEIFWAINRGHR